MSSLFGTDGLGAILVTGPLAYFAIIALIRAFGKRSLSQMNAFDLVVTVALGSLLASTILDDTVPLLEGVVAIGILLVGQFLITFLSTRTGTIMRLVRADPSLVYSRGAFMEDAMMRARVTRSDVLSAVRSAGHGSTAEVDAVVLEPDGSFSVLTDVAVREGIPGM